MRRSGLMILLVLMITALTFGSAHAAWNDNHNDMGPHNDMWHGSTPSPGTTYGDTHAEWDQGCYDDTWHTAPSYGTTDHSGWWYDPVETGGNGLAIEVQKGNPAGDMLFMGWYSYDEAGQPIWYTTGDFMTDQNHYSGTMYQWTGWPLGEQAGSVQSFPVGFCEITFSSTGQAQLNWSLDAGGSGSKTIQKFMNDVAPGTKDSRNLNGWWMDPNYEGMGVYVETQGDTVFMGWYHYGEDGSPRWWSTGGNFTSQDSMYHGVLDEWKNGYCLYGPYVEPDQPTQQGNISIEFISHSEAILTYDGGQLTLQRFKFFDLK